jgi:hypothetical protein
MRIEAPALTRRGFSFASVGDLVVFTMTHRMWGFPETRSREAKALLDELTKQV